MRIGEPIYHDPQLDPLPRCPICGEETNDVYINRYKDEIIGCPYCLDFDETSAHCRDECIARP